MVKTIIRTKPAKVKFAAIKGDGVIQNNDDGTTTNRYKVVLSVPKDSDVAKDFIKQAKDFWEVAKEEDKSCKGSFKLKYPEYGKPFKTAAIREETKEVDDKSDIDEETGKVRRVSTGNYTITAYTNVYWKGNEGDKKSVKVFAKVLSGGIAAIQDITEKYANVPWSIGEGTIAILSGAMSTNGKGSLTYYLEGLQLIKLEKYTGTPVEIDETVDMETIDLDDYQVEDEYEDEAATE